MSGGLAQKRVRVLVVAGVWPHVRENTEAANVVLHELLVHLLASQQFEVAFALMSPEIQPPPPAVTDALRDLEGRGLTVLPSVRVTPVMTGGRAQRIASYVSANPSTLLRGGANAPELRALCDQWRADCALAVWCETANAALFGVSIPRMTYYGNPDHKVMRAQWEFEWKYRPSSQGFDARLFVSTLKSRLSTISFKRAHLRVMRSFASVAEISANDAVFYQRHGVRAFYLRNMWTPAVDGWEETRDRTEQATPLKIVGNVGALATTGNTRGLYTLGTSVLPALKRALGEGRFEVHLFGGRKLHPYLTALLDDPHIRLRGFVPDLDAEILSSPVFLVTNNHTEFKVGNTRFLHAWSLGACVVTFTGIAPGMPEVVHRQNALLASTPDEMADLVAEAGRDTSLRRSLGHGGAETLEKLFDPAAVTTVIAEQLVAISRPRSTPL